MYIKKGRGDFVPDIGVDLDHVEERMLGILSAVSGFEAGDITDEWHLIRDLDLDSLDLAVLAVGCEQEFGIEYDKRKALEIETVGDLLQFLYVEISGLDREEALGKKYGV